MMYLGLALQKRLKEGICSLPVLLVHLLFNELSLKSVHGLYCTKVLMRQHTYLPSIWFSLFSFLFRIACVLGGMGVTTGIYKLSSCGFYRLYFCLTGYISVVPISYEKIFLLSRYIDFQSHNRLKAVLLVIRRG